MRKSWIAALALAAPLTAQPAPLPAPTSQPCREQALGRALDFWIGDWSVTNVDGSKAGENRIERADGKVEILGAIGQSEMGAGDVFVISTPGGGGYGRGPGGTSSS